MPYQIVENATGCNGYAVVKVGFLEPIPGGCHDSEEDAIAHLAAVNLATADEEERSRDEAYIIDLDDTIMSEGDTNDPLIQHLNSLDNYKVVITGRYEGDREQTLKDLADSGLNYDELHMSPGGDPVAHKKKKALELLGKMKVEGAFDNDEKTREMYESIGIDALDPNDPTSYTMEDDEEEDTGEPADALRAVNLDPPEYFRENCRRGLQYHAEGFSGDGLRARTVAEARDIAAGRPISRDKVRRMRAWIARHMVDLDNAPEPGDDDYPSPGQVAHLLWASGTTRAQAQKTFDWTNIKVRQIDREEAETEGRAAIGADPSTPAPKKDQVFGSKENDPGSAGSKQGGIELSEAVEQSLANKVSDHNDRMASNSKPSWTKVTIGALRSVYRRGAGAFSTSHRPGMTRGQWAMGRVNAFLYLAENGKPENPNYVGDNDLLHSDHPRFTGGTK